MSFLEDWWDDRVRSGRAKLRTPSSMPDWSYLSALTMKGTAHDLDPAEPWMRWNRVHSRVTELMTNPAAPWTFVVGVDPGAT